MKKPSERLNELIISLGHNVNSFSVVCEYATSHTIWSLINKQKKPSKPTLDRICKFFPQVNRGWLISGDGEMFLNIKNEINGDLTVTAKQVIDKMELKTSEILNTIVPKMLRHDLVDKADGLLTELSAFLNEFKDIKSEMNEMKKDVSSIHEKITSIEFMETVKVIEEATKKRENGGLDLN